MKDTKNIATLDFVLLGLTLAILALGVVTIYSATHDGVAGIRALYARQLLFIAMGLGVMTLLLMVDYRTLATFAPALYAGTLIALVAVLLYGRVAGGARRWIDLGPFFFQPSEPTKITLILMLAWYYERFARAPLRLRDLVVASALVAMPALLVLKQPDLGTAGMYILIFAVMTLTVGIERRSLILLAGSAFASIPLFWFKLLHPYQKERIETLFNPEADPLGAGYHTIQAKIAVGSGGWLGKGIFAGTQSRLNFVPEKHTDFIFAVLAEESGFIGSTIFLLLYFALLLRAIDVAASAADRLGALVVVGITAMMALHVFFNVGMTMGIAPVVGLPLPLVSYGGSSLLTSLVGIGLILNIRMRSTSLPSTHLRIR